MSPLAPPCSPVAPSPLLLPGVCFSLERPVPSLDLGVGIGRGPRWESPLVLGLGKVYITFMTILPGLSPLLLQEPCFHISPLALVCSEGLLVIGGSQQGAGEPSYLFKCVMPLP